MSQSYQLLRNWLEEELCNLFDNLAGLISPDQLVAAKQEHKQPWSLEAISQCEPEELLRERYFLVCKDIPGARCYSTSPQSSFSSAELAKLRAYIEQGGEENHISPDQGFIRYLEVYDKTRPKFDWQSIVGQTDSEDLDSSVSTEDSLERPRTESVSSVIEQRKMYRLANVSEEEANDLVQRNGEDLLPFMLRIFSNAFEDGAFVKEVKDDFQYEGFSPIEIIRLMKELGGVETKKDVMSLIILFSERGTNIRKMEGNVKGMARFKHLINKYNIISTKPQKRTDITISRIALSFPWVTCKYMPALTNAVVPAHALPALYPKVMRTPAFGSLIPNDYEHSNVIIEVYMLHQYKFNKIIDNKRSRTEAMEDVMLKIAKYIQIAMTGCVLNDDERKTYLHAYEVIKANGTLRDEIVEVSASIKNQFKQIHEAIKVAVAEVFGY